MVFVLPPSDKFAPLPNRGVLADALGSGYIIAFLRENGFEAEQILSAKPLNVSQCVSHIMARRPRVVGFTVYQTNYSLCLLLARELREVAPDLTIVFGGPTPSVQSETILARNDCVDVCVRNEGEETTLELLRALESANFRLEEADLSPIKGLTYRSGNEVQVNEARHIYLNNRSTPGFLDRYPSPYLTGVFHNSEPGVVTARGCNQNCTYCSCAVLSGRAFVTHSIERVVEELDSIAGIMGDRDELVIVYDDAFTLLPARARSICQKLIESNVDVRLGCITRCDRVDEELLDLMKEAGFVSVGFALESATPRVLRNIGKVTRPDSSTDPTFQAEESFIEAFKRNLQHTRRIGLHVYASVMVGLPGESEEEGQATIDLIESLEVPQYSHNVLQIFPGTPLCHDHRRYGIRTEVAADGITLTTRHAYDPYKLGHAPNSNHEQWIKGHQRYDTKALSLSLEPRGGAVFFNNLVLSSDSWDEALPEWLEKYLSVNGRVIQVFSSLSSASDWWSRPEVSKSPTKGFADLPTGSYGPYYKTATEDGTPCIRPCAAHVWGLRCEYPVYFVDSKRLPLLNGEDVTSLNSVFVEEEKTDANTLFGLLMELSKTETQEGISGLPAIPYLRGLCRWDTQPPNCVSLETVIVDAEANVRPCWHAEPIGKVGMPFDELRQNLRRLRGRAEEERGCRTCGENDTCVKCPSPAPLSDEEYCRLRAGYPVEEAASTARNLKILEESFLPYTML
jgi:radical SAM superfamily enzyme YgiQ (UPF0313 family)